MEAKLFAFLILVTLGCAGPTSPFGSLGIGTSVNLEKMTKGDIEKEFQNLTSSRMENGEHSFLKIYPKQQVLHNRFPLKLSIYDPVRVLDNPALWVIYNNVDVTSKFLRHSTKKRISQNEMEISFDRVKISPSRATQLRFIYSGSKGGDKAYFNYSKPSCNWNSEIGIQSTGQFAVSPEMKDMIEELARVEKINPNLIAGLIAQESGFNSKAVSVSKGIGLTQITPIAETEILEKYPYLPRFPSLNEMHPIQIKALISLDMVTETQEWRLNPMYSIGGGLAYLNYLKKYWFSLESARQVASLLPEPDLEDEQVRLILASYNSGFVRVKGELKTHKINWRKSKDLTEANKYVSLVSSYCSLFSQREE